MKISLAAAMLVATGALTAQAQTGSFVATLGRDTMHLERFTRDGNTIDGTIVTRVPQTRLVKYRMVLNAAGKLARYDVAITNADGSPLTLNGSTATLLYAGDTIVRTTVDKGQTVEDKIAIERPVFPGPSIPYVGVSYLAYEQAFSAARAGGTDTSVSLLTTLAGQKRPQRLRAWLVGADSAELDYFGVAKSGYRFDGQGNLIRADWTGTTYRYAVRRGGDVNLDPIVQRWVEADKKGSGVGALSPRDTTESRVGDATVKLEYSRPAARGRNIWGTVVETGKVWRLGADFATHISATADVDIGGVRIPAGRYSLWMQLVRPDSAELIVNNRVNIFGTQYDPRADRVRIPLKREAVGAVVERRTLCARDG
jgi:hypothetical protein